MSSASPFRRPDSSPAILGVGALLAAVVIAALLWFLISGGYFAAFGRWMYETDVGTAVRYVLESLLLLICLLLSTAALIYIERKIWGAVQLRRGPNVVGPWGVLQPFADLLKFIFKEPIIPAGANKGVFVLAPLVSAVLVFAAWAVIPIADGWVIADINVGVLYLFAVSSLGVYGIIMAGWASNSKYPLLSALRAAAQMVFRSPFFSMAKPATGLPVLAMPSTISFVHTGSMPMTTTAATFGFEPAPISVAKYSSRSAPN